LRGQLGEKLIADLIRELALTNGTGLLRLSSEATLKAVFFEEGAPVFAISNLPDEQLDQKLIDDGIAIREQIDLAMVDLQSKQQLGKALVEMGVVSPQQLQSASSELAARVVLSLFSWEDADYVFDEKLRAPHDAKLEWSAAECILQGVRAAAADEDIASHYVPAGVMVCQAPHDKMVFGSSAKLTPVESYILSRLDQPTALSETSTYTGLSEDETRRSVAALVALGLLVVSGEPKPVSRPNDIRIRKLRDEVMRRLSAASSADYYEILGVTNLSTTTEIENCYNRLAQKFDARQFDEPYHDELRSKIHTLMTKINDAYATLRDIKKRRAYDEERMRNSIELHKQQLRQESAPDPRQSAPQASPSNNSAGKPAESPFASSGPPQTQTPAQVKAQGEYYYKLGRNRYEQRDCYSAVQLLREAVKMDGSQPHYHYFLAMALIVISQARHDKHHDGCHVTCKLGRVLVSNPRLRREAEQHLLRAAELDPTSAQVRMRLGLLYKDAELPRRAEHYFREVLSLDPDNRAAQRELETVASKEATSS
jgi:tetratricopeptide (TPR) repeat protein